MTLPGWGRKVLLLAIIPVPLNTIIVRTSRFANGWPRINTNMGIFYPLEVVDRGSEAQLSPYSAGIDFSR